jgi:hypothetical protein
MTLVKQTKSKAKLKVSEFLVLAGGGGGGEEEEEEDYSYSMILWGHPQRLSIHQNSTAKDQLVEDAGVSPPPSPPPESMRYDEPKAPCVD